MSTSTPRVHRNNENVDHFVFAAKYKNRNDIFIYQHIPDFDTIMRDISDRFQLPRILLGFSFNSTLLVPVNNQASLDILFARKQEERVLFVRDDETPQEAVKVENKHRSSNRSEQLYSTPWLEQTQQQKIDSRFIGLFRHLSSMPQHPKRSCPTTSTPISAPYTLNRTNSTRDTHNKNSSRVHRHDPPLRRFFNSEERNDNNSRDTTPSLKHILECSKNLLSRSGSAPTANNSLATGPFFRCEDFERVIPLSECDPIMEATREVNQIVIRPHMHPKFDSSIISRDHNLLLAYQKAQKTRQPIPIYVILDMNQSKVYTFAGNYRVIGIRDIDEPLLDYFGPEGWLKISPTDRPKMLEMHSAAPYRQISIRLIDKHLPEAIQSLQQI